MSSALSLCSLKLANLISDCCDNYVSSSSIVDGLWENISFRIVTLIPVSTSHLYSGKSNISKNAQLFQGDN